MWICVIETTIAFSGSALRLTIVCIAWPSVMAMTAGSRDWSGCAPCAPWPLMRISKKSAAAIAAPARIVTLPRGPSGQLWSP